MPRFQTKTARVADSDRIAALKKQGFRQIATRAGVHYFQGPADADVADEAPAAEAEADYEAMSKDELEALADERGLDVERGDGKGGAPLKADYVAALNA